MCVSSCHMLYQAPSPPPPPSPAPNYYPTSIHHHHLSFPPPFPPNLPPPFACALLFRPVAPGDAVEGDANSSGATAASTAGGTAGGLGGGTAEGTGVVLPPDWEEVFTDDGDPYYSNSVTGETRWEPPPALSTMESINEAARRETAASEQ